jgi:hypothetical protein
MNLHRLDLASQSLFTLVVRTGSIGKGAELAHRANLAIGAASLACEWIVMKGLPAAAMRAERAGR